MEIFERLLIGGAGGHARACIDVLECVANLSIAGLIGQPDEVGRDVFGYPVLGTEADLSSLRSTCTHALVGIGQIRTATPREALFTLFMEYDFQLPVIVSPRAYVSHRAEIGPGSIIMHGAVVNAGARIGRNCIINSLALVEHGVVVADHCHVATGARINGGVEIGEGTFIGSGSNVMQGLKIGDRCLIPMGSNVRKDCAPGTAVRRGAVE